MQDNKNYQRRMKKKEDLVKEELIPMAALDING